MDELLNSRPQVRNTWGHGDLHLELEKMMKAPTAGKVARAQLGQVHQEIDAAVAGGLGDLTLRELLGATLSSVGYAERSGYLAGADLDKGNGSYRRSLNVGSLPLEVQIPRTRANGFRPSYLPERYQRSYPEEMESLILGLLAASRSVNAAKASLKKMALPIPEQDLDAVAKRFVDELELRNTRPLDPDLFALFVDGKYVEVKDGDRLRQACIYVVVGLTRDGHKRILLAQCRYGRENLEEWKKILRSLIERGLRRVLAVIQDDFSGLLKVTQGLFPKADVQLCIVHMARNAKIHLTKTEAPEFQQRLKSIKLCWNQDRAKAQFDELCDHFGNSAPSFVAELRKKRDHYLAFLAYPDLLRRTFSTTNTVEALNGQLERLRRNNGGYFHSEQTLSFKLGIAIGHLEDGKWRRIPSYMQAALPQLNAMFEARFEGEG